MPNPNEAQTIDTPATGGAPETQPNFDTGSALADISTELFGQDGDADGGKPAEGAGVDAAAKPSVDSASPPPQSGEEGKPAEGENSAEVQAVGAPSTWTKEAIEKWATVDPVVQKEILKREEDMFRGLEEYKGRAEIGDAYSKVVEPYKPALEKFGVDPVEMFHNFAGNHYLLSFGTDEQKLGLAASLLDNYNIDLIKLAEFIGNKPTIDPAVAELQREIAELKKGRQTEQNNSNAEARASAQKAIDAFAADPKNIYFQEVADDIVKLLNAGAASSLEEAYDKAVYANPVTREKEIERLTAERRAKDAADEKERQDKIALSTAADVKTRENTRDGTVPLGSMDDTLTETLASIKSR